MNALTVDPGKTDRVYNEYFLMEDDRWFPGVAPAPGPGATPIWSRTTTIHYLNVNDLEKPLDGGDPPGTIQIKEIVVTVTGIRDTGSVFGPPKRVAVRVYKAE